MKDSIDLPDSCSLTTFQLAGMVLSTSVSSNQNVDLTASMKDITLLDDQGRKKNKKIGYVHELSTAQCHCVLLAPCEVTA